MTAYVDDTHGEALPDSVRDHFHLPLWENGEGPACFLLYCEDGPITVRSQQIRAINLAWALFRRGELCAGSVIGVIGAGAGGLTFGAVAATLGATVAIYEAATPMHLQVGCWHRPLHPEISAWPDDTAYRPVSHLPLVGWSSGSADSVAREILNKFNVIHAKSRERLKLYTRARATIRQDGLIYVNGKARERVKTIVIAVGFGIESTPTDLPTNSYWRVDSLDQSFLAKTGEKPTVLISGAGDGAVTDVLRACIEESEQGAFMDEILSLTIDTKLRAELGRIFCLPEHEAIWSALTSLDAAKFPSIRDVDEALGERRRHVNVLWSFTGANPLSGRLPLRMSQFLGARLAANAEKFGLTLIPNVDKHPRVRGPVQGIYDVEYPLRAPGGGSNVNPLRLNCQQVVFRWGKELDGTLTRTIATVFDKPWGAAWQIANSHLLSQKEPQKQGPQVCVKTQGWQSDQEFLSRLKIDPPPKPQLFAKFVAGFDSPDPGGNQKAGPLVFRIRVWAPPDTEARGQESDSTADPSNEADILRPPQRVRIRYDLHPAEGNRPVTRMGFGADRAIWINTRNDYPIRVRTGDGLEWNGHTVLGALFSWYFGEPAVPPEADRSLDTTIEMKVWNANTGAFELNAAKPVRVALSDLIRQTASNNG